MSEESTNPQDLASQKHQIELLARETDMPIELVHDITLEHAKLDKAARIKTYVPLLIYRHVKELLEIQREAS